MAGRRPPAASHWTLAPIPLPSDLALPSLILSFVFALGLGLLAVDLAQPLVVLFLGLPPTPLVLTQMLVGSTLIPPVGVPIVLSVGAVRSLVDRGWPVDDPTVDGSGVDTDINGNRLRRSR